MLKQLWLVAAALALAVVGCKGDAGVAGKEGPQGQQGQPGTDAACTVEDQGNGSKVITCDDGTNVTVVDGTSQGILAGTITNSITASPVVGATVILDPATSATITTDTSGAYSADLPIGTYKLTFEADNYVAATSAAVLTAGATVTKDVVLVPTAEVIVGGSADEPQRDPGQSATLTAAVENLGTAMVDTYTWVQKSGPTATLGATNAATLDVTLADREAYKAHLFAHSLLPDRSGAVAINPHLLHAVETTEFELTVAMNDGKTYQGVVSIHVDLMLAWSQGLHNVPIDVPVMLNAKGSGGDWSYTYVGDGTPAATFDATSSPFPVIVFDEKGEYQISDATTGESFSIYAGTWVGGITGMNTEGRPEVSGCEACHRDGGNAPNTFDDWRETGHAEIFTQNFNTSGHYSTGCLDCHTVGYDPLADNGGIDDVTGAGGFDNFLNTFTSDGSHFQPDPDNWQDALADYAPVAKLANIQCENCHGPNSVGAGVLHSDGIDGNPERVSIASEVCGTCHGEPPRHARYQQWQDSGHGHLATAIDEASVEKRAPNPNFAGAGHCGRCHAGQGFLQWIQQDDLSDNIIAPNALGDPIGSDSADPVCVTDLATTCSSSADCGGARCTSEYEEALRGLGLTEDLVQAQTCVTCHDPHKQGTSSGEPNTSTVRIEDNTPVLPAGFKAMGVGRGALCMMCHNTRNGLHNDDGNEPSRHSAPHAAAQADVLMGENAYFVAVGERSPHSYIADTCANCHLEREDPPADLSYKLGGTNHTFAASTAVCASCHGDAVNGDALEDATHAALADVEKVATETIRETLVNLSGTYWIRAFNPITHAFSDEVFPLDANIEITEAPVEVALLEIHGQMGVTLTLPNPIDDPFGGNDVTVVHTQLGDLKDDTGGGSVGGAPVFAADSTVVKALWNYYLIELDGSGGAHNPGFAFEVLGATYVELSSP